MNKAKWLWLAVALALFLTANVADYFWQADWHGWVNPLWDNGVRAPKWGWLDWIPHDPWHIAQWLRNICMLMGSLAGVYAGAWIIDEVRVINRAVASVTYNRKLLIAILAMLAMYVATRGLGFSLLYKLLNT